MSPKMLNSDEKKSEGKVVAPSLVPRPYCPTVLAWEGSGNETRCPHGWERLKKRITQTIIIRYQIINRNQMKEP